MQAISSLLQRAAGTSPANARLYDPAIGRFISADPNVPYPTNIQSFNRYTYTRNNPLVMIDPSGFKEDDEVASIKKRQKDDGGAAATAAGWKIIYYISDSGITKISLTLWVVDGMRAIHETRVRGVLAATTALNTGGYVGAKATLVNGPINGCAIALRCDSIPSKVITLVSQINNAHFLKMAILYHFGDHDIRIIKIQLQRRR
ncbi:MAG: RHS repeat-associated core domain-containing protein [Sphingomonadaceae bacterium]